MRNQKTPVIRRSRCSYFLFASLLSACGGGGGGDNAGVVGPGADATAPTVSGTLPLNLDFDVATTSTITATFNEAMLAATINTDSFTLAISGADDVPGSVSFDSGTNVASFVPDNPLSLLADYTATLSTAITDLSGNGLATDYSWSFAARDGAWGNAELLEDDDMGDAGWPQVAFGNNGTALTVWSQYDGSVTNIWAKRFDGTGWGTPELIETEDLGHASEPQIAFDDNGNAIAVWTQSSGTLTHIWANRFDGSSWGTAGLIERDEADSARRPQIAFGDNGMALAVWRQFDGGSWNIWANLFDGTGWGTAELIESEFAGDAYEPQVAFDSNGNAIAVWYQVGGSVTSIWANRFDGARWGAPERIETDNAGDAISPRIAFDADGTALAVWQQSNGTSTHIWANRFDGTSWWTAELIETNEFWSASVVEVANDGNGTAIAVWFQFGDSINSIWSNRFDGSNWGTPELLESHDEWGVLNPHIAFDKNGNAIAVWEQFDGVQPSIWANRFDGSRWGAAELIETGNGGSASNPRVAIGDDGAGFIVWEQSDGTQISVWSNRFE